MSQEFDISKVVVKKATEVDAEKLKTFFVAMYKEKGEEKFSKWKWLYRIGYSQDEVPIVCVYDTKVIAFLGMIAFKAVVEDREYSAAWNLDFGVIPGYRGDNIGSLLAIEMMTMTDLCLATQFNEASLAIGRKIGWEKSENGHMHYFLLNPAKVSTYMQHRYEFLITGLNPFIRLYFRHIYKKQITTGNRILFADVNTNTIQAIGIGSNLKKDHIEVVRDEAYINWRLLESPDVNEYKVAFLEDNPESRIIVNLKKKKSGFLDILYVPNQIEEKTLAGLISALSLWGMGKGYTAIRYFTTIRSISNYIKSTLRSTVRSHGFIYYSKNKKMSELCSRDKWNFQFIESDMEWN